MASVTRAAAVLTQNAKAKRDVFAAREKTPDTAAKGESWPWQRGLEQTEEVFNGWADSHLRQSAAVSESHQEAPPEVPIQAEESAAPMSTVITPQPGNTVITTDDRQRDQNNMQDDKGNIDHVILTELETTSRASALAAAKTDDGVGAGFKESLSVAYQVQGESQLEASKNAAAIGVQADKNTNQISNQAIVNANAVAVQNQLNAAAVALQIQTVSSASVLLAQELSSKAAAQLAECCCELRTAITFDGQKTRDLVNTLETDRLRDRNLALQGQLAAYYTASKAPSVP